MQLYRVELERTEEDGTVVTEQHHVCADSFTSVLKHFARFDNQDDYELIHIMKVMDVSMTILD